MTETPLEVRNPDRNRRALWIESILVLGTVWLPLLIAGAMERGKPRSHNLQDDFLRIMFELGTIYLLFFLLWRNHESLRHICLRKTRWWSEILWAILIYISCWISWIVVGRWTSILLGTPSLDHEVRPAPERLYYILLPGFLLVSAFFEELLVRGYLWNRLRRLTGSPWVALLGSSALFTAYHPYRLRSLLYVFTFGVVIGIFRWTGRSLPRLVLAHALCNISIEYDMFHS